MHRKSTGEYPIDWPEISFKVKEEADWKCVRCHHPTDRESGHVLTTHHLDMDISNCAWWNIPPLCQRCHLHIQHKVIMEQFWGFKHTEWFQPYAAGYYASINGYPTDKGYVLTNMEFFLNLGRRR